jgi:uncharacterized protein with NRDE domain
MCTVSWHTFDDAFTVLFNRDECLQRQAAQPPAVQNVNGIQTIYPIDPEGGGTWLGVNTQGVALCMLNFYEQENLDPTPPATRFISRGQLLLDLLSSSSVDEISAQLIRKDLEPYRPFHFLLLSSREQNQWTWDSRTLSSRQLQAEDKPLTTSSLQPDKVFAWRRNRFRQTVHSLNDARAYHYHQEPEAKEFSVRMEREYARTVSISEIRIDPRGIQFTYDDLISPPSRSRLKPAPPCTGERS